MSEDSVALTKGEMRSIILGYSSSALREVCATPAEEAAILKQIDKQIEGMDCMQIAANGFQLSITPRDNNKHDGVYFKRCEDREKSLGSLYPKLAKEWDVERNGGYTAFDILPGSNFNAHWKCKRNHRWQARVKNRTKNSGCPYCSGRLAIPGKTDFGTKDPGLRRHWHPELNEGIDPTTIPLKTKKEVWWICDCGGVWKNSVYNESLNLSHRCRECKRKSKFAFIE